MVPFLIRRILSSLVVIFCVVSLTFLLMRMTKGGPFDREKEQPAEVKEMLMRQYHLDGTLWQQYTAYMGRLAHFDLGFSTKYRNWRVSELLAQKLPSSITIGSLALLLASVLGVLLGTAAAMHKDRAVDRAAMWVALLAISIPTFISGPILIALFALWLRWLPPGGWGTLQQVILPSICLAGPYLAYVARLMRNSLLDVLRSDFMRTARAKGLSETAAVTRHAVKIALLPVITFLGPLAAQLLTGSMVIESVFNISGAGSLFVNSIQNRDAFLLGGAVIVLCVMLVFFNLVVDLLYTLLDPRIRLYHAS